ncbi:chemotaxis protein CheX [Sulfurimonas sp. HSL-1716]|uniref:chemotaxis protein CheX n=1 Tax=Hydrocurvibacter sulfurireducens TaxID=3131937 RepID=UPI0031F7FB5E
MLSTITKAATNFCEHQIRKPYSLTNEIPKMRMFIASINIMENSNTHKVYVAAPKELLEMLCGIFLFEEECDEETLKDMLMETANMIVGSAKVIAQENGMKAFDIRTPVFLDIKEFNYPYDAEININIDNTNIIVAIKENNAA